jgi:VWFA-related protein
MPRTALLVIVNTVLACLVASGQAPSPGNQIDHPPVIRTTTHEVLVDLVVRDKHHRLIRDLRPEEVEISEDGVPQRINAFRNIEGAEQLQTERRVAKNASAAPVQLIDSPATVKSLRQVNFVAIVFADIAPLNVEFAREAVLEFLKSDNLPNTYVSIYRLGRILNVARFYTDDKELLAKSVDGVAKGLHTDDGLGTQATVVAGAYSSLQATADNLLSSAQSNQVTQTAVRNAILNPLPTIARDPLFARDAASQDVSVTLGNALLAQARIENGIRFARSLANGMDALDSLHEIVRSQETLPGRKVVLYLSDGLGLPMNRRDAIDNLISYANRAGVAIYAVDTRGLNIEDPMMRSLSELERVGAVSSAQRSDPIAGHKEEDDIQLTAVNNRQLALRELAESTGGFAVTDTNEISGPMQRVMEDIRSHYELAYTPVNSNYNGRFRKIEVKVLRPHVTVQTRKGYFALPDLNGQSLQPFEAAALRAINAGSTSKGPPYHLAVMKFRPGQNAVEHQVAFEIPLSGLCVTSDPKRGKGRVRISLFAVIRNWNGDVVGKIGRELTQELANFQSVPQLGKSRILYAETVELIPGHYNVDAALTDEQTGQISVKRLAFFVAPAKDFGLSSLELVREHDNLSGNQDDLGSAQFQSDQIVPTLADSVSSGKALDVYFVLYPAKIPADESPKVVFELLHDGKEVVRKPLRLPNPKADGSIPMRLRFSPMPGQYDIFVVAQQGELVAQSSLSVKVQ